MAAGSRIVFLASSGGGMLAEIAENRPNEFISIKHIGMITDGVEDTESDAVRAWTPAYENYSLVPVGEGTRMVVDQDVTGDWEGYMRETWPKALEVLKALAEVRG